MICQFCGTRLGEGKDTRRCFCPRSCGDEARAIAKKKEGAWIHRMDQLIKHHNADVERAGICQSCRGTAALIWGRGFENDRELSR